MLSIKDGVPTSGLGPEARSAQLSFSAATHSVPKPVARHVIAPCQCRLCRTAHLHKQPGVFVSRLRVVVDRCPPMKSSGGSARTLEKSKPRRKSHAT